MDEYVNESLELFLCEKLSLPEDEFNKWFDEIEKEQEGKTNHWIVDVLVDDLGHWLLSRTGEK